MVLVADRDDVQKDILLVFPPGLSGSGQTWTHDGKFEN